MNKGKKAALLLAALLLMHGLCGCSLLTTLEEQFSRRFPLDLLLQGLSDLPELPFLQGEASVVAFGEESVEGELSYMTPEELKNYESPSLKYGSTVYFQALNEDERIAYNAVLYALDHDMQILLLDDRLLTESDRPFVEIYQMASLDSPLIPQNMHISSTHLTLKMAEGKVRTTAYTLSAFSKEQAEKRAQALQKAEKIVKTGKLKATERETVQYFYRYLGKNVSYTAETGEDPCYLYDALITGKTLCDGYANALSLLCNMAGIPCFEKAYFIKDDESTKEQEAGHTWNCVYLEGKWSNVDATVSEEIKSEDSLPFFKGFGYGDELQEHTPDLAALLPEAEALDPFDLILPDLYGKDVAARIEQAFVNGDHEVRVLFLEKPKEDPNGILWKVAKQLLKSSRDDVGYYGYAMAGKYVCYFYEA